MLSSIGIAGTSLCPNVKYCTYVIIDVGIPQFGHIFSIIMHSCISVFLFLVFTDKILAPTHILKSRKMLYFKVLGVTMKMKWLPII